MAAPRHASRRFSFPAAAAAVLIVGTAVSGILLLFTPDRPLGAENEASAEQEASAPDDGRRYVTETEVRSDPDPCTVAVEDLEMSWGSDDGSSTLTVRGRVANGEDEPLMLEKVHGATILPTGELNYKIDEEIYEPLAPEGARSFSLTFVADGLVSPSSEVLEKTERVGLGFQFAADEACGHVRTFHDAPPR